MKILKQFQTDKKETNLVIGSVVTKLLKLIDSIVLNVMVLFPEEFYKKE